MLSSISYYGHTHQRVCPAVTPWCCTFVVLSMSCIQGPRSDECLQFFYTGPLFVDWMSHITVMAKTCRKKFFSELIYGSWWRCLGCGVRTWSCRVTEDQGVWHEGLFCRWANALDFISDMARKIELTRYIKTHTAVGLFCEGCYRIGFKPVRET